MNWKDRTVSVKRPTHLKFTRQGLREDRAVHRIHLSSPSNTQLATNSQFLLGDYPKLGKEPMVMDPNPNMKPGIVWVPQSTWKILGFLGYGQSPEKVLVSIVKIKVLN